MNTLVMKFGGSSVGNTTALTQVLSIVLHEYEHWNRLILVVSALDGVTDALIEAAHLAQLGNHRGYRRIIANLRTRHLALVEELLLSATERTALQADVDRLLFDILDLYHTMANAASETPPPDALDATIGVGERLATRIVAALLRQQGVRSVAMDTTDLIITDDVFGNATPNLPLTSARIAKMLIPTLERRIVPVLTGFIGATPSGKPTTLGRGGSDYTASVLAVCTQATEVWIWTSVDGMMSADPQELDQAQVIAEMSYDEVAELAYFGARVLHARMITPLREHQIPLRVKNVYKPQQPGTLVHALRPDPAGRLKAVTSIAGLGLSAALNGPIAPISNLVDQILFSATQNHADVMFASQSANHSFLCFLIPTSAGPDAVHNARALLEERLSHHPDTAGWTVMPVSIVTVIRDQLDESPILTARVLQTLSGIRILGLAQGPSHCSLSIIIDSAQTERALHLIHEFILNSG